MWLSRWAVGCKKSWKTAKQEKKMSQCSSFCLIAERFLHYWGHRSGNRPLRGGSPLFCHWEWGSVTGSSLGGHQQPLRTNLLQRTWAHKLKGAPRCAPHCKWLLRRISPHTYPFIFLLICIFAVYKILKNFLHSLSALEQKANWILICISGHSICPIHGTNLDTVFKICSCDMKLSLLIPPAGVSFPWQRSVEIHFEDVKT